MQTVDQIIDLILKHEGGFVNNKADRGGATKYGVTQATLTSWRKKQVTVNDVKNLTLDEAKEIYLNNYFKLPKIDQLPQNLQAIMTDMAVNHGPARAYRLLSRALIQSFDCNFEEKKTLDADLLEAATTVSNDSPADLNNAIVDVRSDFFKAIVANNSSQKIFLKGWLNRSESFRI